MKTVTCLTLIAIGAIFTFAVTAHPSVDYEDVVSTAPLVVDFRGVTRSIDAKNLIRL